MAALTICLYNVHTYNDQGESFGEDTLLVERRFRKIVKAEVRLL
jgi:hypothetical protein